MADGVIDQEELEFLSDLKHSASSVHPGFDDFFLGIVKKAVLQDGSISDQEARRLRKLLWADRIISERELRFLEELRTEAKTYGEEFEKLYSECAHPDRSQFAG